MNKIIIIGLLFSSILQASPTKNEFISCQKISVKQLEHCLDIRSDYKGPPCWEQSKNAYDLCHKEVMLSHNRKAMTVQKTAALKEIEEMKSHDYYKKKAIHNATESKQILQKRFNILLQHLKESPLTGDKEHDTYILNALKQNQKDWLAYQYSTCQSQALLEVYPTTSRLYAQSMNICIDELNSVRIKHINNLMKGLRK